MRRLVSGLVLVGCVLLPSFELGSGEATRGGGLIPPIVVLIVGKVVTTDCVHAYGGSCQQATRFESDENGTYLMGGLKHCHDIGGNTGECLGSYYEAVPIPGN